MKEPVFPRPETVEKKAKERPSVVLRLATVSDAEVVCALNQKMKDVRTYSAMDDLEEQREELEKTVTYLIEKDAKVVGYVSYEIKSEGHAYLSSLVIDPEFQRQGIGREALTNVLRELETTERIDLTVHPENSVALQLYLSLGFQIESRGEDYYGDGEPRLVLVRVNKVQGR